jgi:hypothetical protein
LKSLRRGGERGSFWGVDDWQAKRLTDAELKEFFERLFPHGFAGADVLAEIAPEGWEKSPLLACFHPSVEQVFKERVQIHRNIEELICIRREREPDNPELARKPEPTLEEVRMDWQDKPVNAWEEVIELVALCLWDVFSNNHEVIAADGRVADIGSFRGAARFLVEYLTGPNDDLWNMDYCRFYMGTIWISDRADLTPVYGMIFHRLKALGADWEFHFPQLGIMDLSSLRETLEKQKPEEYSPSEAFGKEQEERERQAELERFRAELAEGTAQARREAMDHPPPATVIAYQTVYGCDPKGWPPV